MEVGHSTCQPAYRELSLDFALYAYWGVFGVSSHKILYTNFRRGSFGCDCVLCILEEVGFNAPIGK